MLELLIYSILIAIASVVFSCILMDEDMIFGFYSKLISKLPTTLSKPLGECSYCFGGQVALWYYFLLGNYKIDTHIFFVLTTIFFIHLILYIYERTSG